MPDEPRDPNDLSPMRQSAVALHEMFLHYVAAGFLEDQALRLIAYQLKRPQDPPRG